MAGSSYQSIFESFSDALTKLNTALYEQEDALNTMLGDASTTVHGDLASYNLDAFAFGDYPSTTVNVAMDA